MGPVGVATPSLHSSPALTSCPAPSPGAMLHPPAPHPPLLPCTARASLVHEQPGGGTKPVTRGQAGSGVGAEGEAHIRGVARTFCHPWVQSETSLAD